MKRQTFCAHCDTLIVDESTVVDIDGQRFCCRNCSAAWQRAQEAPDETPTEAPLDR